jgi:hypothetical protein
MNKKVTQMLVNIDKYLVLVFYVTIHYIYWNI